MPDQLVQRLSQGRHPLIASRANGSTKELKASIERGHVFIKFTQTRGGTELGIRFDPDASDLSQADFDQGQGTAHLVGNLTLNYTSVRCVADVDLATLQGQGYLDVLEV